ILEATRALDWSEAVKTAQINWIGKSKGAEIDFKLENGDDNIWVFTTRPDTLFGATFIVLAPEHELVQKITTESQKSAISNYVTQATKKTEVERQASKEKTGVFTGAYALNPVNDQKIPVWIADYVLMGYGTGAIMAVPAHDERDMEFAEKYDLSVVKVVKTLLEDTTSEGIILNSGEYDGMSSSEAREKIVADLSAKGVAEDKTIFKIRDWSVSRQRYWGAPIPIINCEKCGSVLVPDEQLPVVLPELEDFQPSGDGRSALARATDWLAVECPECGGKAERETDTIDTYVDSSWYMLRYFDPTNKDKIFDSEVVNKWMPIDFYNGADHATAHLIYARFITRFLHMQGLVNEPEPFKKFLFNGKVMASDGQMFSKSKGNGVDPLEIIEQGYGADALRTYLMFAAPLDLWARWDPQGVPGTYRFLNRVWNLVQEFLESKDSSYDSSERSLKIIHPAIQKVTGDIEDQKYNTAIAAMMKATNELYELKARDAFGDKTAWMFCLKSLVAMMAPFAPHIAEELWKQLGHNESVSHDSWPIWDDKYLISDTVTIVVQINGKVRAELQLPADITESSVLEAARADAKVQTYLTGEPKKTIYVPGKLVNFVI
ncbi:MAG: leucine--tRNA ligase, partial [bacterium]|nr:leucine--tRNA ligase [bacterium]